MLKLQVIGNLGSDAELQKSQGQSFVSLSIAHTEKRKQPDGSEREFTTWISATINGDGGNLLPYLKKGTRVYAYGDVGLKVFHSEKERCMKAGINLFVRNIELLGGSSDDVPRDIYDLDGVAHHVGKFYYCDTVRSQIVYDRGGREYQVDASGWVTVSPQPAPSSESSQSEQSAAVDLPTESDKSTNPQHDPAASTSKSTKSRKS